MSDAERESLVLELVDILGIGDSEELLLKHIPKASDDASAKAFQRYQVLIQFVALASTADNVAEKCDILKHIKAANREFKVDFPQLSSFEEECGS